jgi:hypothetical protein
MYSTVLELLLKNNLLHLFYFGDDTSETLELKTILFHIHDTCINFGSICKQCHKLMSQLTHKIHFKTITEAKMTLSLNTTAESMN